MDLASDEEFADALVVRVTGAIVALMRAHLESVGEYIDMMPADDLLPHEAEVLRAYIDAARGAL